jgi:hypothetical protein
MAEKFKNRLKEIEKKAELNMVRAVNHGLRRGKTVLIRLVRSEVRMKHRDVSSLISINKRATRSNPEGVLKTLFKPQGLIKFGAKRIPGGRGGIKVRVSQQSAGSTLPNAFIKGTGNSKRVVIRRSDGKLKTLYSASAEQVIRRNFPKVADEVEQIVKTEFIRLTRAGI